MSDVKQFASAGDLEDKPITFSEIGPDLYAFTAEGDPNSGVIVGDDAVMVVDTQATPVAAQAVIERIRTVTDKPIRHVGVDALSRSTGARRGGLSASAGHRVRGLSVDGRRAGPRRLEIRVAAYAAPVQAAGVGARANVADAHFSGPHVRLSRKATRRHPAAWAFSHRRLMSLCGFPMRVFSFQATLSSIRPPATAEMRISRTGRRPSIGSKRSSRRP